MPITVIQGEQRGDEGKGKFVDMLAPEFDIVSRYGGAGNAGHTVVTPEGQIFKLHLLPSGVIHPEVVCVLASGVLVDPVLLDKEIVGAREKNVNISARNLLIAGSAHLTLPHHISLDEINEAGRGGLGSTKSGVSPTAADRARHTGVRAEIINHNPDELRDIIIDGLKSQAELRKQVGLKRITGIKAIAERYVEAALTLSPHITDTSLYLNMALKQGKNILAEGAQAFLLDPDHGMYPYVTSTPPGATGVSQGMGVPPTEINSIIGVVKVIQSHVGGGPFVTEFLGAERTATIGGDPSAPDAEWGAKTGRRRRTGHLDLPVIRRAQMVNGTTERGITKLDWLSRYGEEILVCVGYTRKGKLIEIAPDAAYKLDESTPLYVTLKGWDEDISGVRHFEDLPKAAQDYVNFVERETDAPITMIGVGQGRDEVIDMRGQKSPNTTRISGTQLVK